ncbi:MAG TPA: HEAT repeat domain-containing protein, partial [Pyrinomonadaceae bacterium]
TPVNHNNEYLIRWITGVTFSKLTTRKDFPTLFSLLKHKYWTVRNSAASAIVRLGDVSDLQSLVDFATSFKGEFDGVLKAVCDLDERIYSTLN